jgi:uncharacterized protein
MKIALIGAGYVGSQIINEALSRGHQVTVIVRHPEKISPQKNLTAQKGNVFNEEEITPLLKGHDAVISAYSPGPNHSKAHDLQLSGTLAVMSATKKAGIKRFLVVGGAGSLEAAPGVQLVDTPDFPKEWYGGASGLRDALNEIRKEKELDWSFLSPSAVLQPGERTGKYRIGSDQLLTDSKGESRISVPDYAMAMIDELQRPMHVRKRFTVGY